MVWWASALLVLTLRSQVQDETQRSSTRKAGGCESLRAWLAARVRLVCASAASIQWKGLVSVRVDLWPQGREHRATDMRLICLRQWPALEIKPAGQEECSPLSPTDSAVTVFPRPVLQQGALSRKIKSGCVLRAGFFPPPEPIKSGPGADRNDRCLMGFTSTKGNTRPVRGSS